MKLDLRPASPSDVAEIVAIRLTANQDLTARFGYGPWSGGLTSKGVLFEMRRATVYLARAEGAPVATFALSIRKPWSIDISYFSAGRRPVYLTAMAVDPAMQGCGIGRQCLEDVRPIAIAQAADSIRLDAYDSPAGAGGFYARCGFREVGRATYRSTPLIYFELLL